MGNEVAKIIHSLHTSNIAAEQLRHLLEGQNKPT